jgi:hypothetical protein
MNDKFRFGAERHDGHVLLGPVYDDFDECYEAYVKTMGLLKDKGADLSTYKWRGVYSLHQIALLVSGNSIYFDKLTVEKDAWA